MDTYSTDLRERVLTAYDTRDGTVGDVAEQFSVSKAWIYKLVKQRDDTGSIEPLPHGGGHPPAFSGDDLDALRAYVDEHPDATLMEIRDHFGGVVDCSHVAIHNTLKRLDYRFKKKRFARRSKTAPTSRPHARRGQRTSLTCRWIASYFSTSPAPKPT